MSRAQSNIMVDLETLGTAPGSAIASFAGVAFDPVTGQLGQEFYQRIDVASCQAAGLTIDASTFMWWLGQSDPARDALRGPAASLASVLDVFNAFYRSVGPAPCIWGHGGNFDEPLLTAAYRAVGMTPAWKFWDSRCTRTIFGMAEIKPDRAAGVHHNALDDARAQAQAVCQAYQLLGLADSTRPSLALLSIANERHRQVAEEGWSAAHDDGHRDGELVRAAAAYALEGVELIHTNVPAPGVMVDRLWPWSREWWKPRSHRENLVRAGALIAAQIEKIDRADAVSGRYA